MTEFEGDKPIRWRITGAKVKRTMPTDKPASNENLIEVFPINCTEGGIDAVELFTAKAEATSVVVAEVVARKQLNAR